MNTMYQTVQLKKRTLKAAIFAVGASLVLPFIFAGSVSAYAPTQCIDATCTALQLQHDIDATPTGETLVLPTLTIILDRQVNITHEMSLDGGGSTLIANFTKTTNANNSAIGIQSTENVTISNIDIEGVALPLPTDPFALHGINVYQSTNVTISNVNIKNNLYSIIVNASTVNVSNVTSSGNAWGGINVDKGTALNPATLELTGPFTSTSSTPPIVVDNPSNTDVKVIDNGQYPKPPIDPDSGKLLYATPTTTPAPIVAPAPVAKPAPAVATVTPAPTQTFDSDYSSDEFYEEPVEEGETLGETAKADTSSTSEEAPASTTEAKKSDSCSKILGACWYFTTPVVAILLGGVYYYFIKRAGEA